MNLSKLSAIAATFYLTVAASAAPVSLALKFPVGQFDKLSSMMNTEQTLTGEGLPGPQKQTVKMGMDMLLKVLSSDDHGATVEMTFDRITTSMSMFGRELAFDSQKDKPSADNPVSGIGVLVGVKLKVHFAKDGKVDKVEGIDELKKKLSGESNPATTQVLQQTMNEDHLKQTINGAFADAVPSKPVDIGDSWQSSVTQNIMGGMAIKMTAENKLVAVEDKGGHKIATIEFKGVGKIEGAAAGAPKLKADEITQKGSRYFDIDRGAFTEMNEDQTLKGGMTVQTPNGDLAIKIDKTTTAKMTLKPVESK